MLRLLLLYRFWLTEICICRKPSPTRNETCDLQIALSMTLILPFFYTPSILHARHIRVSFELWGRPFCSSLLVSFFQCFYERNSIHTASLSHFISLIRSAHHHGWLLNSIHSAHHHGWLLNSFSSPPWMVTEFNSYSFIVTFYFSHSFSSPPWMVTGFT